MNIMTVDVVFRGPQITFSISLMLLIFCTSCQVAHVTFVYTVNSVIQLQWFSNVAVHDQFSASSCVNFTPR